MSVVVNVNSPPPAASATRTYLDRLAGRVEAVGTHLCLGVDPDPASLPQGFSRDIRGIEAFARLLVEVASPYAAAIKANVAFFEAYGSEGVAALERVRGMVPSEIPFIADAKRGDISTTAARQATALYDALGADAVTANPYLGREAIAPLLDRSDRFVYVLCRTSNPGAAEFQNLAVEGGDPLYVHVARSVAEWSERGDPVGLVVGATAPAELVAIRAAAPGLPFLVPGIGAQGGDLDAVRESGPASAAPVARLRGGGLIVNVSRGIASAAVEGTDPGPQIALAAEGWARRLQC
jgi:orotidine-5'-phosphate decarboxylase